MSINSKAYWQDRFETGNWEEFGGRGQTEFFYRIAVESISTRIIDDIRKECLSICDLGCAEGDGIDVLSKKFTDNRIVGIDFSESAIEKACEYYPSQEFYCLDINDLTENYDVIFSSNTFEHFNKPFQIINKCIDKCDKYFIFIVPLKEYDRHKEHFYTFDYFNIPQQIKSFKLVNFKVIDCSLFEPRFWNGDEIVCVYANEENVDIQKFNLEELNRDLDYIKEHRILAEKSIYQLEQEKKDLQNKVEDVEAKVKSLDDELIRVKTESENFIENSRSEKDRLVDKIETITEENKVLNEKILNEEKSNFQLNEELIRNNGDFEVLLKKYKELERSNEVLFQEKKRETNKLVNEVQCLNVKVRNQENEINELIDKMNKDKEENNEEIIKLEREVNNGVENLSEKERCIEGLKDNILENSRSIEGKEKHIKDLSNNIIEKDKQVQLLNQIIVDKDKVISDWERMFNDINNLALIYKEELKKIYASDFWNIATKYYKVRDNMWPFNKIHKLVKQKKVTENQIAEKEEFEAIGEVKEENLLEGETKEVLRQEEVDKQEVILKEEFVDHKNKILPVKSGGDYDVIYLSIIDYKFRHQRPQHIAGYMAKANHRVYYFNANFMNDKEMVEIVDENLAEISMRNTTAQRIYDVNFYDDYEVAKTYFDNLIKEESIKCGVVYVSYPNWEPIARYLKEEYGFKVIFDYLDDFSGFNTNNPLLVKFSNDLFDISDKIIATSDFLYNKAIEKKENVATIRNGTEFNHFNVAKKTTDNKRPIIGYYGAIAEWFDMKKIEYLAQERPEYDIHLIGDYSFADVSNLKKLKNVKLFGEIDYKELPKYLSKFDVSLIPFNAEIDLIKATNPVKFYEYLSAAKKIVATEIPELMPYRNKYVYLANENDKFVEHIDECINETDILLEDDKLIDFAKTQDWSVRCSDILKEIDKSFDLASIVIVTYNNLDYTKACLKSIEEYTQYPNYEIIIVDNLSKDGTRDYLKEIKDEKIKVILNDNNSGFAGGNNIGLRVAKGEYLILLNNDTVVTRGWISSFVKHFKRNGDDIGMYCPVTNSIGNEAKINVNYKRIEQMHNFAEDYTRRNINKLYEKIDVLAMFCVMLKRTVFEEIGELDENFIRGMFEDDDYSYRIKKAGYKIACAEDVFIHHKGGATFKKIEDKEYQVIFGKNKKYYEEKWDTVWIPHKYRPGVE